MQEEYKAIKQEQIDCGLVPAKPEFRTHEQRLLDEQLRLQNELKLEKLERKRQKERLFATETASNSRNPHGKPRKSNVQAAAPPRLQQKLRRSFGTLSEIEEGDNRMSSINHSLKASS